VGTEIATLRRLARAFDPQRLAMGTVGVGAVDAAVGAAAAIAAARPARVIFVGTAGAYPRGARDAAIGTVAIAASCSGVDGRVARRRLPARAGHDARADRRVAGRGAGRLRIGESAPPRCWRSRGRWR
jgi:nucleoside phosphorylase